MLKRISVIALVIAALITYYFYSVGESNALSTDFPSETRMIDLPQQDTAFGGLFYSPHINDSLPHQRYKQIEDSFKRINDYKQLDNRSISSEGRSIGAIGIAKIKKTWKPSWEDASKTDTQYLRLLDTVEKIDLQLPHTKSSDSARILLLARDSLINRSKKRLDEVFQLAKEKEEQESLYYFALRGYSLDHDTKFFYQDGTYNLAYTKLDTIIKNSDGVLERAHYERKQIRVRYSTDEKKVLIPITKKQHGLILGSLGALSYLGIFLVVYFFIGMPLQIVVSIARGEAFSKKNIRRFHVMSYAVFINALINIFVPYFFRYLFSDLIPPDLKLEPVFYALINNLSLLFIALVIFIVGKAFQRGYNLQHEQELTI